MVAVRLRCARCETEVHGSFEPPLSRLSVAQQVFAVRFLLSRGNLKELERVEGVAYQTLRGQLDEIVAQLLPQSRAQSGVFAGLRRGELNAEEALRLLESAASTEDDKGGNQDG